jgi:septal ring factor EnvC (AmiA/AmiB activator)
VSTASRGSRARRLRYVAAALLVLLAFTQPASVFADTQHELQEARKKLGALRKDLHELRAIQQGIHSEILSITARLSQATAQIEARSSRDRERKQHGFRKT